MFLISKNNVCCSIRNYLGTMLVLTILVFLPRTLGKQDCSGEANITQMKVITGNIAELKCFNLSETTWSGPRIQKTLSNMVLYADGYDVNNNLTNAYKISVSINDTIGEYVLCIVNISREEEGTYQCAGRDEMGLVVCIDYNVTILDPPSVKIEYVATTNELQCIPKGGEENNTSFDLWEHLSEYKEHIRYLPGSPSVILKHNNSLTYKSNGYYRCTAHSGIIDRQIEMSDEVFIHMTGKPGFVSQSQCKIYGRLGQSIDIVVYVYSYPVFTNMSVLFCGQTISFGHKNLTVQNKTVKDTVYDMEVSMLGYEVGLRKSVLQRTDYGNYTFYIRNEHGESTFQVQLISSEDITGNASRASIVLPTTFCLIILCIVLSVTFVVVRGTMKKRHVLNRTDHSSANDIQLTVVENSEYLSQVNRQPTRDRDIVANQSNRSLLTNDVPSEEHQLIIIASTSGRRPVDNEINYSEVMFAPAAASSNLVIHRLEERTIYSDVDLSVSVSPLPDSDGISNNEDDDDFMSLDGIVDYTQTRQVIHES